MSFFANQERQWRCTDETVRLDIPAYVGVHTIPRCSERRKIGNRRTRHKGGRRTIG